MHAAITHELKFFLYGAVFTLLLFVIFLFIVSIPWSPFAKANLMAVASSECEAKKAEIGQKIASGQLTTEVAMAEWRAMGCELNQSGTPNVAQPITVIPYGESDTVITPQSQSPNPNYGSGYGGGGFYRSMYGAPWMSEMLKQQSSGNTGGASPQAGSVATERKIEAAPLKPAAPTANPALQKAISTIEQKIEKLSELTDNVKKFKKEAQVSFKYLTVLCSGKAFAATGKCDKAWAKQFKKVQKDPEQTLSFFIDVLAQLNE